MVTRQQARRMFGVTARQWKRWVTDGKVRCGIVVPDPVGGRRSLYPLHELKKLREELFSRDNLYKNGAGGFKVPAGWSRRREACQMFGLDKPTWHGWAQQGLIPTGRRFDGGPTLYRIEDLKNLLERVGKLAPPYPDPQHPDAYRVPLCGRNADGREAIIDRESLPLLEGATLSWGSAIGGNVPFVALSRPDTPRGVAVRRAILGVADDNKQVGHLNGDALDCRRANLFARTIAQRTYGARKMRALRGRPCTSRFKGVCFESWTKKWRANIVVDGKRRSLGRYADEIAAAQAYDDAARELFGQYAWLNFPDGVDVWLEKQATNRTAA
jgi:hypothetical protein